MRWKHAAVALVVACSMSGPGWAWPSDTPPPVLTLDDQAGPGPQQAMVRTDGSEPLYVAVIVQGAMVSLQATSKPKADLVVTFSKRKADGTVVHIQNLSAIPLKLDLYLSGDGRNYAYTSSCPLRPKFSSFEMWPESVAWLALARARVPSKAEQGICI